MAPGDSSIRQLVDELSNAALRDLLRNVRHHTELRRQIASGMLDERAVNRAYREYARREGPSYRQQAADLTLEYYSSLTELGNRYSERFYDEVLNDGGLHLSHNGNGAAPPDEVDEHGTSTVEEVPIELHGPPGREITARFSLENTEDRFVEVSIDVGPCSGPDEETFIAPLVVQPARFTLRPGETRPVTLRVAMLPSVFTPGYLYRVPVHVHGAAGLMLQVTIWAEEPDVGVTVPPAAPATATEAASPPAQAPPRFTVRCPACHRQFDRAERSDRLYPHKTPDGDPCPARQGRVRAV